MTLLFIVMAHSQSLGRGARGEQNKCGVATKVVNLTKDLDLNVKGITRDPDCHCSLRIGPINPCTLTEPGNLVKLQVTVGVSWHVLTVFWESLAYHTDSSAALVPLRSTCVFLCSLLMSACRISVKWKVLKIIVLIRCIHYSCPDRFNEEGLWDFLSRPKALLFPFP